LVLNAQTGKVALSYNPLTLSMLCRQLLESGVFNENFVESVLLSDPARRPVITPQLM
jgi:hypothetical protein